MNQPELAERLRDATAAANAKGRRWFAEMWAEATVLADAGQPAGFGDAAARVYGGRPRPVQP